jgi:putative flippase GtrA
VPSPEARVLRVPNIRRARRADWEQLVRFCVVGTSGYFVNLGVFSVLVHVAGAHYALAAVVAFCVAWTNNFLWNKYWTFRRHGLSAFQQGVRYLTVSLVALALGLVLLELLVRAGSPEVPAQALSIAAVMPINFLLNRRWSFR